MAATQCARLLDATTLDLHEYGLEAANGLAALACAGHPGARRDWRRLLATPHARPLRSFARALWASWAAPARIGTARQRALADSARWLPLLVQIIGIRAVHRGLLMMCRRQGRTRLEPEVALRVLDAATRQVHCDRTLAASAVALFDSNPVALVVLDRDAVPLGPRGPLIAASADAVRVLAVRARLGVPGNVDALLRASPISMWDRHPHELANAWHDAYVLDSIERAGVLAEALAGVAAPTEPVSIPT